MADNDPDEDRDLENGKADDSAQEESSPEDTVAENPPGEDADTSANRDTGEQAAPPGSTDEPLLDRLLAFNPEDWLVIVLLFLLVGVAVVSYVPIGDLLPGGQQTTADPAVVEYCEQTAAAVEANATLPQGTMCECMPPGTFDERQFSVGPKVDNATELFLVSCTLPNDQKFLFPIRQVSNESINASQQFPNRTVVN